jgi:hypothetical protein
MNCDSKIKALIIAAITTTVAGIRSNTFVTKTVRVATATRTSTASASACPKPCAYLLNTWKERSFKK